MLESSVSTWESCGLHNVSMMSLMQLVQCSGIVWRTYAPNWRQNRINIKHFSNSATVQSPYNNILFECLKFSYIAIPVYMYSIILYSCMVVYYQYFNKIIINAYIVHVIYCRCSYTTSITKSFFLVNKLLYFMILQLRPQREIVIAWEKCQLTTQENISL